MALYDLKEIIYIFISCYLLLYNIMYIHICTVDYNIQMKHIATYVSTYMLAIYLCLYYTATGW